MNKLPHYVYKIVNKINNKEYIGVRSHSDPTNDSYMGSSKIMNNLYQLEGLDRFEKTILEVFETREEAENYEASLLTEEWCNSPDTYNVCATGHWGDQKHGFRKELWFDYYDDIRARYVRGETLRDLGAYYGCDGRTIEKIVSDVKRTNSEAQALRYDKYITSAARDPKWDKYTDEMVEMYVGKLKSIDYIASSLRCHRDTVRRRLKERGVILRNHKEAQELRHKNK